jgi:hypothetical protein
MGAYADGADVQALIPEFTIGASTKPSTSEVAGFISQIEAAINGVLSAQGYSTIPATGDNDVALLEGVVAQKVAAMTLLAAYPQNDPPGKVKLWSEDYKDFMNRLRQGQQHLVDQLPQGESEPIFAISRHPTRDDLFTERGGNTDWDE